MLLRSPTFPVSAWEDQSRQRAGTLASATWDTALARHRSTLMTLLTHTKKNLKTTLKQPEDISGISSLAQLLSYA